MTSKFYLYKSLGHKSIDKCPWSSKKCMNIIYTHQFLKQKSHFPLPNVIFLQQSCQMSKGAYFTSEPLFIEWKKKKIKALLLLFFNQQNFWMQMNKSPLWWFAVWVSLSHTEQAQWMWLVSSWVQGKIKDWHCYQWIMRFVFISENKVITEPSHRLLYVCSIYFSV